MDHPNTLLRAAEARSRRKKTLRRSALATLVAGLFAAPSAQGQVMRIEPAIAAEATVSNNGNQAPRGQEQGDIALEVRPEFWLSYQTSRLRLYGVLGATATTYIGGDQTANVFPSIDLGGTLQAIRNFFYIDADVVAERQFTSPFAPRSTTGDQYAYASYAYRVAPYFQGDLPSLNLRYLLRSDFLWTRGAGATAVAADGVQQTDTGYEWRIRGELATTGERKLNFTYQYDRDYLRWSDLQQFTVEVGRAIASYQLRPDLAINARAGYEWEIFPASEGAGPIYGAGASWRPSPRTNVSGWWEHRFFGGSWQVDLSYRVPWFAVSFDSSRELSTTTQSLFDLPRTNDVFRSLDAILSSRVPDPVERSRAVRDLLAQTGLPSSLATPIPFYSQRVNVAQTNSLSVGLLGARNSLFADLYDTRVTGITAEGEPLPAPLRLFTDETQRGVSLTWSHRLARADSFNATAVWQQTQGSTQYNSNAESTQWTARLQYNRQISRRTTAYAGVRYVDYTSNVFPGYTETAAFVGLYHRFY